MVPESLDPSTLPRKRTSCIAPKPSAAKSAVEEDSPLSLKFSPTVSCSLPIVLSDVVPSVVLVCIELAVILTFTIGLFALPPRN